MAEQDELRVVIVMGVSGSGKSTVGRKLAAAMGARFYDADDFHPPENIAKMSSGEPLDDGDRRPWLERLRQEVILPAESANPRVLACSALKKSYRDLLADSQPGVRFVYLKGGKSLLLERIGARTGHYMKSDLLDSQFADLEEPSPEETVVIEVDSSIEAIVNEAKAKLA